MHAENCGSSKLNVLSDTVSSEQIMGRLNRSSSRKRRPRQSSASFRNTHEVIARHDKHLPTANKDESGLLDAKDDQHMLDVNHQDNNETNPWTAILKSLESKDESKFTSSDDSTTVLHELPYEASEIRLANQPNMHVNIVSKPQHFNLCESDIMFTASDECVNSNGVSNTDFQNMLARIELLERGVIFGVAADVSGSGTSGSGNFVSEENLVKFLNPFASQLETLMHSVVSNARDTANLTTELDRMAISIANMTKVCADTAAILQNGQAAPC